jgi:hypothetical protein
MGWTEFFDYDYVWQSLLNNKRQYGKKIWRSAFVNFDNSPRKGKKALIIRGASPSKFEQYLEKLIKYNIIFCEDLFTTFCALDDKKIFFGNEYFIWYQYGTGISTNGLSSSSIRMKKDYYNHFVNCLPDLYKNSKVVKKGKILEKMLNNKNSFLRKIMILCFYPQYYFYKIFNRSKMNQNFNQEFIETIISEIR